jgi:predicted MPP superfamily phosphohydrolase
VGYEITCSFLYINFTKVRTERLSHHVESIINTLYKTPLRNLPDYLIITVDYFYNDTLRENAFKQTLTKGLFSRFSTKKKRIL